MMREIISVNASESCSTFFLAEQHRSVIAAPRHNNEPNNEPNNEHNNEHNNEATRQARRWMDCALPSGVNDGKNLPMKVT